MITDEEAAKRKRESDDAYAAWGRARDKRADAQRAEDEAHNNFITLFRLHVEAYTEQMVRKETP